MKTAFVTLLALFSTLAFAEYAEPVPIGYPGTSAYPGISAYPGVSAYPGISGVGANPLSCLTSAQACIQTCAQDTCMQNCIIQQELCQQEYQSAAPAQPPVQVVQPPPIITEAQLNCPYGYNNNNGNNNCEKAQQKFNKEASKYGLAPPGAEPGYGEGYGSSELGYGISGAIPGYGSAYSYGAESSLGGVPYGISAPSPYAYGTEPIPIAGSPYGITGSPYGSVLGEPGSYAGGAYDGSVYLGSESGAYLGGIAPVTSGGGAVYLGGSTTGLPSTTGGAVYIGQ